MKKPVLLLVTLVLLTLGVHSLAQDPVEGGEITIGIRFDDFGTLDPHVTNLTQTAYVFGHIFEKLVYLDSDGNLLPWLATSWEPSEDYMMWTLTLREGVTFHDGTPFNAEAVQFNFDRMVAPETNSRTAGPLLGSYLRTEVVDDLTVQVFFEEPFALFSFALTSPWVAMVSPTAVETYGDDFDEHLIGTGPFTFVSQIPQVEVILEKNPDYAWGPADFRDSPAYLDRITFRLVLEEASRLATLETGETQIIDEIPATRVAGIQDAGLFQVRGAARFGIARSMFFNTDLAPTDDLLVRQALLYGTDREGLNEAVFRGVYPVAYQVLTPGVRFYDDSLADSYPYDPERAIALLEEAGWTEINDDGYRVKDGQELFVNHATFAGYVAEAPSEIIQAQLRDIGVRMDITVIGSGFIDIVSSTESPYNTSLLATYSPDPGLILYRVFHSSNIGSSNWAFFATEPLDELLQTGLETADEAERADIYTEVQQILQDNAVVIPLYANVNVFGLNQDVQGFSFNAYGHPELQGVWLQ
ncbi:MAG: ABC transporter substrate-binding protein [Deinococcota bacterium]